MNIRLNIRFNDFGVFSSAKFENVMLCDKSQDRF